MNKIIFCSLLLTLNARGATYRFQEAVAQVKKYHFDIQSSEKLQDIAEYEVRKSQASFLPSLALVYDATKFNGQSLQKSSSLILTENLFNGFYDEQNKEKMRLSLDLSRANYEGTLISVSFDFKSAYAQYFYTKKLLALSEDIVKKREQNLKLVLLRFETGRENAGAVQLSKANLLQAKYETLTAEGALKSAEEKMHFILGLPLTEKLVLSEEMPLADDFLKTIDLKKIKSETIEEKKAKLQELLAQTTLESSKAAFLPKVSLSEKYEINKKDKTLMLSAEWALFDGGKDYYSIQSAIANKEVARMNREKTEWGLETAVNDALRNYEQAKMKIGVDEAFLFAARTRDKIATAQYNNGLISFTDWDTIQNELFLKEKLFLQTNKDRAVLLAALEQNLGRGVLNEK